MHKLLFVIYTQYGNNFSLLWQNRNSQINSYGTQVSLLRLLASVIYFVEGWTIQRNELHLGKSIGKGEFGGKNMNENAYLDSVTQMHVILYYTFLENLKTLVIRCVFFTLL